MPEEEPIERAREDERQGLSPSTQAGEFVREEMEHIREGEHGARSPEQAIAIGLSKARRAGVKLPPPKRGKTRTKRQAKRDLAKGRRRKKPSRRRSRAVRGCTQTRKPPVCVAAGIIAARQKRGASPFGGFAVCCRKKGCANAKTPSALGMPKEKKLQPPQQQEPGQEAAAILYEKMNKKAVKREDQTPRSFRCKVNDLFRAFSRNTASAVGSAWAFIVAISVVIIWAATGGMFHFSDTWQLIINTGTTIVTFLMVFLIQNTQNRDGKAIQLKLDELIRALERCA